MFSRLTLGQKLLCLVAIPVFCELLSVATLFYLLNTTLEERNSMAFSAELVSQLDALLIMNCKRATFIALAKISGDENTDEELDGYNEKSREQIDRIDTLVRFHPQERLKWEELKKLGLETQADLHHATYRYYHGRKQAALIAWASYQQKVQQMYKLHKEFTENEEQLRLSRLEREKNYSHMIGATLLVTLILGVASVLGLAIFFNRSTGLRLSKLMTNARSMAAGDNPVEVLTGSDELSELHKIYTDLHRSLSVLRERESAILKSAAEGIVSLDEDLRVVDANLAFEQLLVSGAQKTEIGNFVGRRLGSILSADAFKRLEAVFLKSRREKISERVELDLMDESRNLTGQAWSIVWSESQMEYFCIVQDTTVKRRLEKLKEEFLAMVSHDIRSPLASIEMTHSLLLEENLEPDIKKSVEIAHSSTKRLLALVNNLLDLEKIEDASMEIEPINRAVLPTIQTALDALKMVAERKKLRISIEVEPELCGYFDNDRIFQVLVNLLSNSYKYSSNDSRVRIRAQRIGKGLQIAIIDQGKGIPPEKLEVIFERYLQVSTRDHKEYRGTGLGLAICRALVARHGGWIKADSDGKHGSTFSFFLPDKQQN